MAKKRAAAGGDTVRHENPLMPDERLRQMYTAMVQIRMLEEYLRKRAGKKKGSGAAVSVRGEEAARVSTTLSLSAGDLLSDCSDSRGMELLLGGKLSTLKKQAGASERKAVETEGEEQASRLPLATDAGERLQISLGAAAALKAQRAGRVVLVYAGAGEASRKRWKKALTVAGKRELPILFVVLPGAGGSDNNGEDAGELCQRSRGWGVPGFPVDGSDAIAMYRVMQESLLRARSDGGPALIECVPFLVGKGEAEVDDPVERLGRMLVAKGVADEVWLRRTRSSFAKRLGGGTA